MTIPREDQHWIIRLPEEDNPYQISFRNRHIIIKDKAGYQMYNEVLGEQTEKLSVQCWPSYNPWKK